MNLAMIIFGLLTVLSACGVVFAHKTLHSALWLVCTFFLVAVHYALLGADFLAALQVMVYAGAIMVLVIFVIMLLGLNEKRSTEKLNWTSFLLPGICAAGFLALALFVLKDPSCLDFNAGLFNPGVDSAVSPGKMPGSMYEVSHALFTTFLFPFEVISLLLLSAIIGAVMIAFDPKRPLPKGRGLAAKRDLSKGEL